MKYYVNIDTRLEWKELEWTTTPPTEAGWYWVKSKRDYIDYIYAVFVSNVENQVVWTIEINNGTDFSDFTHWLGPLPMPEPPKE